jgi:hypothetical protein
VAETPTASVVVVKADGTYSSFSDSVARRTADERLIIESREGPYEDFRADQWREVWVYKGNGSVFAHEYNRLLPAKVTA